MPNSRTDERELSRREFSLEALSVLFAGVAITVTACDDDGGGSVIVGPGGSGSETGAISANHGHEAIVSSGELTAGNAITRDIRGSADHPHIVSLSATEIVQIRDGQRVTTTSTTDASAAFGTHSHVVTFN
ncbi:MAG: hypothetical protein ACRD3G_08990 [Vicinamibacterales bacterium]